MTVGNQELERFHFPPAFEVFVDPEFPGDGDWRCNVYGFGRDGDLQDPFRSVWGPPLVVEVVPTVGDRWIGQYAAGGLGGVSGVYATPAPSQLCVVVEGLVYLTDVHAPEDGSTIVHDQVGQVVAVEGRPLLLCVRFIDIVAVGIHGVAWRSSRLAVDELRVNSTAAGSIECTLDNLGGTSTITLDAETGDQISGTRLDWSGGR